jgi:hypothetical protein
LHEAELLQSSHVPGFWLLRRLSDSVVVAVHRQQLVKRQLEKA